MTSPTLSEGCCIVVMDIKERRFDPLPHEISLEDLVPQVNSVVFFRLQLVMFFEGLRSERVLMRVADRRALCGGGTGAGEGLYFDATKVDANASLDSIAPRFYVEDHLGALFECGLPGMVTDGQSPSRSPDDEPRALSAAHDEELLAENAPMLDLLWRSVFRWQLRPRQITEDTAYGTTENIAAVERAGIRVFVPLTAAGKARPFFSKEEFAFDANEDLYRCPAGEVLLPRTTNKARRLTGLTVYKAKAGTCEAC